MSGTSSTKAAVLASPVLATGGGPTAARGANRSTKVAGKLKVLPDQPVPPSQSQIIPPKPTSPEREKGSRSLTAEEEEEEEEEEDADSGEAESSFAEDFEVYNQIAQIPEGPERRDAIRLTKKKAKSLPRVTAYATATSFRMSELMKFLRARKQAYRTNPRLFDEVIYTTYSYGKYEQTDAEQEGEADLLGIPEFENRRPRKRSKFAAPGTGAVGDIFLFEYGTVVIWGLTEPEEKRFLSSIRKFEVEKLGADEVEMEDLNYYYAGYSRIYNDVITLRKGSSYMTKLSLSHALAQSVKISLFEELISSTIEETKDIPEAISETGRIGMPHSEILQQIGDLFLLRLNINLVGSVLDSPEIFWSYPDLQPLYEAARGYLEIPQRVGLLNTRVEVLQDMLQLLKETVSSRHAERLEQIVIALIGIEIGPSPAILPGGTSKS